jgi:hypothetical protein
MPQSDREHVEWACVYADQNARLSSEPSASDAFDRLMAAPVTVHAQLPGGGMLVHGPREEWRCGRCSHRRKVEHYPGEPFSVCVCPEVVERLDVERTHENSLAVGITDDFGCRFFTAKPAP